MLEETVFKNSDEDAKTRQYRDRCKNLQLKLKVSNKCWSIEHFEMQCFTFNIIDVGS